MRTVSGRGTPTRDGRWPSQPGEGLRHRRHSPLPRAHNTDIGPHTRGQHQGVLERLARPDAVSYRQLRGRRCRGQQARYEVQDRAQAGYTIDKQLTSVSLNPCTPEACWAVVWARLEADFSEATVALTGAAGPHLVTWLMLGPMLKALVRVKFRR